MRSVILDGSAYKFRGISESRLCEIVLVFVGVLGVGKVTENFLYELLLLDRGRCELEGLIHLVHAFSRGDIFCITANLFLGVRLVVIRLEYEPCHALPLLPFEGIVKGKITV